MARKSAKELTRLAANASSRERKAAALITLEATEPDGRLDHPETVLAVAENVDGAELAEQLQILKPDESG